MHMRSLMLRKWQQSAYGPFVAALAILIAASAGCDTPATPTPSGPCSQVDAATGTEIAIAPCPGEYLTCGDEPPSMILEDVVVETSVCNADYFNPWSFPEGAVKAGDACLLIHGRVRNRHLEGYWVAIHANGYDSMGREVSWTLDAAHVAGSILISVGGRRVEDFTLHLNPADDLTSVEICSQSYSMSGTPPP